MWWRGRGRSRCWETTAPRTWGSSASTLRGRHHQRSDTDENVLEDVRNVSIPAKLRKAGKEVITERPPLHKVKTKGKEEAMRIVNRYKGQGGEDEDGGGQAQV